MTIRRSCTIKAGANGSLGLQAAVDLADSLKQPLVVLDDCQTQVPYTFGAVANGWMVEATCKTVVCQRVMESGVRWRNAAQTANLTHALARSLMQNQLAALRDAQPIRLAAMFDLHLTPASEQILSRDAPRVLLRLAVLLQPLRGLGH